ncbi:heparinase II/III-like protein [Clostridium aceticum]|uniref:Heparinase II/III-like protein n=1 Tax=Clostridium aceticum TaxID=84022 RepID=A0A0G3W891_9CLOT|nr:alginate lyase family protein [Clostridium aceticum]AKL93659.1 heparinase II/III-like protein [Clostridium aceticum]
MKQVIRIMKTHTPKEMIIKVMKRVALKTKYTFSKRTIRAQLQKYEEFELNSFSTSIKFYYDETQCNKVLKYYNSNKKVKAQVLEEAQNILDHNFNILNATLTHLGEIIHWNKDYKSGFVWENVFYKDIQIIDLYNNADVKVVWELSRFNHLFALGKAYWLTNDKRYYHEFKKEIISWERANPYCMSVNWTCSMEVAIRAINWIFAYFHFRKIIDIDIDFKNKLNKLLYYHGKFIYCNLENYNALRNNHYIANLVGLLYLGLYFSGNKLKKPDKWIKKAIKDLHREMKTQINEDGTSYETSTNYQRVVAELFLHAYMIGKLNGISFDKGYIIKLKKMHSFLAEITKPNGLTPLLGDIDNGRLLIISKYHNWEKRDFSQMLDVADYFLGTKNSQNITKAASEELIWLSTDKKIENEIEENDCKLKQFSNGGFYLLKNPWFYVVVRCGELSMKGQGGHSHNDQLSFELNVKGRDIIIDPGSYTYSGSVKLRNFDRSTANHNTISVENFEQNQFSEDIFSMKEETFSEKVYSDSTSFIGKHYGYKEKIDIVHKRKICIDNQSVSVIDTLIGEKNPCKFQQNFILDPEVEIVELSGDIVLLSNEIFVYTNLKVEECKILETYISIGYGHRVISKKIEKTVEINRDIETRFIYKE